MEVALKHATSQQIIADLRNGSLDAGFYNESGKPDRDLVTIEVSRFRIYVVVAPGTAKRSPEPNWESFAELPWIYPTSSACCGKTAENLFTEHRFKPKRIVSVDRQEVTRTLVAGGLGVGLLHADIAKEAENRGEIEIVFQAETLVSVLFAYLSSRRLDPLLDAASSIIRGAETAR